MGGLQRGVNFFNENIVPFSKNSDGQAYLPIEQIILGPGYSQNFSSGFGTTDGNSLINDFLNRNVDALMPVAGDQTTQAVRMIKQRSCRTIVVGVDSASELNTNANLALQIPGYKKINGSTKIGGTNNIIQFSSLKKLDQMTLSIANNINNNICSPLNDSTIGGLGYHSLGNIENNCVGISDAGYQFFIRAIKLYLASYDLDPNSPSSISSNFFSDPQTNIDESTINSIFQIPNSNDAINNPESNDYKNYYTNDLYNSYASVITKTDYYKNLDLAENKKYIIENSSLICSYADIPNCGNRMMPLNQDELVSWFNEYEATGNSEVDNKKLNSLLNWLNNNKETVDIRANFNLENELNKSDWEDNHSVIKVALNAPNIPLLDKSFNESAFDGLILYWKSKGVIISKPN